ncbi:MAG: AI-2E family transporter [Gammaproteobacteria bacterium]|nr:AI-2E family transporter [Gammaproteobacteria bacterium]
MPRRWLALAALVATLWLVYALAPVLTPFFIATLLAYLGDPLVDRLEVRRVRRTAAVLIVFAGMFLLGVLALLVLLPLLYHQVLQLLALAPRVATLVADEVVPRLGALQRFGITIDIETIRGALAANWSGIGTVATDLLLRVGQSGQALLLTLGYLVLIPVVTFYLLRDWDQLLARLRDLLPRRIEGPVCRLAAECDAVLAQFLRGQLAVMLALAVVYTIGLWLVGVDSAFAIGMLSGLVSFVPYLGVIVGMVVAGFAVLVEYQDWLHLLGVGVVFGAGQMLEGMVLSPWLVGERIGLHPVAVMFAVMAGGQLFGFTGVVLALPVAAVVVVLLRHVHQGYLDSDWYA